MRKIAQVLVVVGFATYTSASKMTKNLKQKLAEK
jgi:hypothetical protein